MATVLLLLSNKARKADWSTLLDLIAPATGSATLVAEGVRKGDTCLVRTDLRPPRRRVIGRVEAVIASRSMKVPVGH